MRVSYNWLKDYVAVDLSPRELAERLTARGVVVENLVSANPGVEGVVVGKVREIERHPDSDHLWVCQVDVGGGRVLQILTGAQNVTAGALVPAAVPGSKLPGMEMAVKKLRGLESHGMLCSEVELQVGDDGDGIMILPADQGLEPGMDVAEVLGLNDWIMELDLTANYAAHCQSMVGVAQEVAALVGGEVILPETYTQDEPGTDAHDLIAVRIDAPELCSRYAARVVRGVKIGPSPLWLQARIRAAGMRPINNIVDIANFVMMELGQPLHTFDYRRIRGRQIIVRRAGPGERFTTLDEQERVLDENVLVIADGEGPVALAGVMGGLESEVTDETVDILIESAHFDNINNRRTALRYNLPSEAAKRFTKGVDPSGCILAADRAAQLMAELAAGTVVAGCVDVYPRPAVPPVILLRTDRANALTGLRLSPERMAEHLRSLGMAVLRPADLVADLALGAPEQGEEAGEDLGGRPVWTAVHQVSPVPADPEAYRTWAGAAWRALEEAGDRLEALAGGGRAEQAGDEEPVSGEALAGAGHAASAEAGHTEHVGDEEQVRCGVSGRHDAPAGDEAGADAEQAGPTAEGADILIVVAPTRRSDIAIEVDLIEEIARCEGYDQIPLELPTLPSTRGGRTHQAEAKLAARRALAGAGLTEVLTHSLVHPRIYDTLGLPADDPHRNFLTLANPMYDERSTLRTMLLPGLLDAVKYNANRQIRDLAIFEISHVYLPVPGQPLPDEPLVLGLAMTGNLAPLGWRSPEKPADFFALKGVVEHLLAELGVQGASFERSGDPVLHPGRQAALMLDGKPVGLLGELHPRVQEAWELPGRVYVAEIAFGPLVAAMAPQAVYRPVPRFPAVARDVAMLVDLDTPASRLEAAIREAGGDLLEDVRLFDLYQGDRLGEGKRSLAYRLTYRAADRTLTDAELEPVHNRVRNALHALGVELRS